MSDRFPTSADLRYAAGCVQLVPGVSDRLLALADALDAGTIRWPEEEPARTCGTCVHDRGAMCRELTRESGSGPVARWTAAWWSSRTRSPKPGAPSCPGHADKVTS